MTLKRANVSHNESKERVEEWAITSRGTELPRTYGDELAIDLFEDQAKSWK
jgi:hypothetical protein